MLLFSMFNNVFAKFSRKAKFKGELIPLNDRVFDILRASEIGRALLALNDDAEQRIYRSPYDNLAEEQSMSHKLESVAGYYIGSSDSILIAKSVKEKSIIDEAEAIAHELAHRFQSRYQASLTKKHRHASGYPSIIHTLLIEMHAKSIADLVLVQALQKLKKSDKAADRRLVIGIENHLRGKVAGKIANDNFCSKDINPSMAQKFFVENFEEHLSDLDAYIAADLKTIAKQRKKKYVGAAIISAGTIIETVCSITLYANNENMLASTFALVAAGFMGVAVKCFKDARKLSHLSHKPVSISEQEELFDYSAVRLIPTKHKGKFTQWHANDNDEKFLNHKIEKMIDAIDEVREKGPVITVLPLSGEELRGYPIP